MAERRYWTNSFDASTWPQRNPARQHWERKAHRPLKALEPGDLVFGYVTKVGWAVVYECVTGVRDAPHESQWGDKYPLIADVRELLVLGLDSALHTRDLPPDPLLRRAGGSGRFIPSLIQKAGQELRPDRGEALLAALIDRWRARNPGQTLGVPGAGRLDPMTAGADRQPSAEVRRALEQRAMAVATAHFEALGFGVEDVSRQAPYDLRATRGTDLVRIEVKGSSGLATSVELTRNEVEVASASGRSCLAVVDGIGWEQHPDGTVDARGGHLRVWNDWTPARDDLQPLVYRYRLPS